MSELVQDLNYFFNHSYYAILMLFFVLIQYLSEPIRWFIYLSHTKTKILKILLEIFSLTFLANYILPFKLGIPIRVYLLNKRTTLDFKIITILIATDGVLCYLLWTLVGSLSFIYLFSSKIPIYLMEYYPYILVFVFLVTIISFSTKIIKNLLSNLTNKYNSLLDIKYFIIKIGSFNFTLSIFVVIIDICSHLIAHLFIFYIVGIELTVPQAISITSLSIMIGIFSLMPMGLVGYDATMILLLQKAGIGIEISLLVPVLNRLAAFIVSFSLGSWAGLSTKVNPFIELKKLARLTIKR